MSMRLEIQVAVDSDTLALGPATVGVGPGTGTRAPHAWVLWGQDCAVSAPLHEARQWPGQLAGIAASAILGRDASPDRGRTDMVMERDVMWLDLHETLRDAVALVAERHPR